MSNFIARMLDRTLRSSDAVHPVVKPIFVNEVTAGNGHSMTPPSHEKNRDLHKKVESTEYLETDASAPDSDLPSVPPVTDKKAFPDESMHSNRVAESQIVSRKNNSAKVEKAGGEERLSSGKKAARDVFKQSGKPENHDHSSSGKNIERIVSEQIETSEISGLSEKHNMDSLKSSSGTWAERKSALKQKKAATDNSFNSHINVKDEILKESGVSEISGLPDKHNGSQTRSYNVKLRSEQLFKSPFPMKELKGADKEDLLIPSDFKSFSHPEASSELKQKELSIGKSTSFDKGISSTAPPVKVTIGRIEVRAVMQQASSPPRRTVPAQPKLSLADYLKRREGGLQ